MCKLSTNKKTQTEQTKRRDKLKATDIYRRWSPQGHGLGLEVPRKLLVMSLVLASNVVSLTSEVKSLALEVKPLVLIALALRALFFILIGLG